MEGVKVAASSIAQGAEKLVEALGGKSPTLITMGGPPETHILGETVYSQVPLRSGANVAKISVAPASTALTALTGRKLELDDQPSGLRDVGRVARQTQWHGHPRAGVDRRARSLIAERFGVPFADLQRRRICYRRPN